MSLIPKPEEVENNNEADIIEKHFLVNMDRWVKTLFDNNFTIETFTVPLSVEEGRAFLHKNQHSETNHSLSEEDGSLLLFNLFFLFFY